MVWPKWTVMGQIGRSFAPKLTVMRQSVKVDGPKSVELDDQKVLKWTALEYQSMKVDGPESLKWTLQKYESGRSMNIKVWEWTVQFDI